MSSQAVIIGLLGSDSAITFSESVPFDAHRFMPEQNVSSVLAFTISDAAPVYGSSCYVRLVADGINAPTFTDMLESGSSMGYDNRDGIVNTVSFWYDGYDYWYAIIQAVDAEVQDTELRFLTLSTTTEGGNGNDGFSYTFAGFGSTANGPSRSLPAAATGWVGCTLGTITAHSAILGVVTAPGGVIGWTAITYGIYGNSNTGRFTPIVAGAVGVANGNGTTLFATGDLMRLRRVGTDIFAEVSKTSGASWILVHTFVGASTAELYPCIATVSAAIVSALDYEGLTP